MIGINYAITQHPKLTELLELPPTERLELVAAIWDSLVETPEAVPMPDWHRRVVEERLTADDADTTLGELWDDVRHRIEGGG